MNLWEAVGGGAGLAEEEAQLSGRPDRALANLAGALLWALPSDGLHLLDRLSPYTSAHPSQGAGVPGGVGTGARQLPAAELPAGGQEAAGCTLRGEY